MTRYISSPENLKQQMNLLKEKSKNIQFEAFHVFKVRFFLFVLSRKTSFRFLKIFVANPSKPKPIVDILLRNQEKLIEFLSAFHADREICFVFTLRSESKLFSFDAIDSGTDDDQFNDEKAYLIKQISELKEIK